MPARDEIATRIRSVARITSHPPFANIGAIVTDSFNPYREWLGLDGVIENPNYYQLLSLDDFESDFERIRQSADRAITRVRGYRPGPRAPIWAELLDVLKQVKQELTEPESKRRYDELLRAKSSAAKVAPRLKSASPKRSESAPKAPAPAESNPSLLPSSDSPSSRTGAGALVDRRSVESKSVESKSVESKSVESNSVESKSVELGNLASRSPQEASVPEMIEIAPMDWEPQQDDSHLSLSPSLEKDERASSPNTPTWNTSERVVDPMAPVMFEPVAGDPMAPLSMDNPAVANRQGYVGNVSQRVASSPVVGDTPARIPNSEPLSANRDGDWAVRKTQPRAHNRGSEVLAFLGGIALGIVGTVGVMKFVFKGDPKADGPGTVAKASPGDAHGATTPAVPANAGGSGKEEWKEDPSAVPVGESRSNDGKPAAPVDDANMDSGTGVTNSGPPADSVDSPAPAAPDAVPMATPEELRQLAESLKAARLEIAKQSFVEADALLAKAESVAKLPDHKAMVSRLRMLAHYQQEYRAAIDRAMKTLEAGVSFPISDTTIVAVVERRPDSIVIKVSGRNKTYPLNELPLKLGLALADQGLEKSPGAMVVKGAFQALNSQSMEEQIAEVRGWWEQAAADGEPVADLIPVLDDDYDALVPK